MKSSTPIKIGNSTIPLAPYRLPPGVKKPSLTPEEIAQVKAALELIATDSNKPRYRIYEQSELQTILESKFNWKKKLEHAICLEQFDLLKNKTLTDVWIIKGNIPFAEGAFGKVYFSFDMDTNNVYMIKTDKDDSTQQKDDEEKKEDAIKKHSALSHGRHASLILAGSPEYQVMKYAPGFTLNKYFEMLNQIANKDENLNEEIFLFYYNLLKCRKNSLFKMYIQSFRMLLRVVDHHVHRFKSVHRDIKELNIKIDENGEIYLLDFDESKEITAKDKIYKADSPLEGTAGYTAPECRKRIFSVQSDIYAIAVIMINALDMVHPDEIDRAPSQISKDGIRTIEKDSKEFKANKKIKDPETREYILMLLKQMAHVNKACRPETNMACVTVLELIYKFYHARKAANKMIRPLKSKMSFFDISKEEHIQDQLLVIDKYRKEIQGHFEKWKQNEAIALQKESTGKAKRF